MIEKESNLEHALKYLSIGWSVFPIIPLTKKPIAKWKKYQSQLPTEEQVISWWSQFPNASIALATGKVSGTDVVDIDGDREREIFENTICKLPGTIIQKTGRGIQAFFAHGNNGFKNVVGTGEFKGIDLKTTGGYVLLPPSIHKSGKVYSWLKIDPIEDGLHDLLDMPAEIAEHFKKQSGSNGNNKPPLTLDPVPPTQRNDKLARLTGRWINQGMDFETAYLTALGWYEQLPDKSDFPKEDVYTTVDSVFNTHERNHPEEVVREQETVSLDFPQQVITGAAGFFAKAYGEVMEAPRSFLFMSYLTCLGAYFSPHLKMPSVLDPQARLYLLLIGRSNLERKSTTIKAAVKLFKECTHGFKCHHGVGSDMGLARLLAELDDYDQSPKGTLLIFDEFKTFVNKCKIQAQVLLQCVNTLFENNEVENATKNKHIRIENAHLSILAATTLQTYERIYDREFIDIGFPNRVFIVPDTTQRKFPIPKQIASKDRDHLEEHIKEITALIGRNLEITISEDAQALYNRWYYQLPDSIYADRMETYSLRLAMLLAVNDRKAEVDLETMQKATALCDWQIEVRREHDPIDAEDRITEMEERIRRVLRKGPKSDSAIKKAINPWKGGNKPISLFVFHTAFKNLQNAKEIKRKNKNWFLVRTD